MMTGASVLMNNIENWKNDVGPDIMIDTRPDDGGGSVPKYTGDGVVIGILDPGVVMASNSNFDDINLYKFFLFVLFQIIQSILIKSHHNYQYFHN